MRADGEIDFPEADPQIEGDLVLMVQTDPGDGAVEVFRMKLTVVEKIGAKKFFPAARDYIFENNTELYIHDRIFDNPTTTIRVCCMREEATDMLPYELWKKAYDLWVERGSPGTFVPHDHREAAGIQEVVDMDDSMTVVINGNQCAFENGNTWVETLARFALFGEYSITDRCHGRIGELNKGISIVSSDHYDPSTVEPGTNMHGSYLAGPDPIPATSPALPGGKFIAEYGNGWFRVGAGRAPETILDPSQISGTSISITELGGGSTNYGLLARNDYPNQMVGWIAGMEEGEGVVFTATGRSDDDKGKVVEFYNAAKSSDVAEIAGATTTAGAPNPIHLILMDSGVTFVGLANRKPNGDLKVVYAGQKHLGTPYFTNTFLSFKAEVPRPGQ